MILHACVLSLHTFLTRYVVRLAVRGRALALRRQSESVAAGSAVLACGLRCPGGASAHVPPEHKQIVNSINGNSPGAAQASREADPASAEKLCQAEQDAERGRRHAAVGRIGSGEALPSRADSLTTLQRNRDG